MLLLELLLLLLLLLLLVVPGSDVGSHARSDARKVYGTSPDATAAFTTTMLRACLDANASFGACTFMLKAIDLALLLPELVPLLVLLLKLRVRVRWRGGVTSRSSLSPNKPMPSSLQTSSLSSSSLQLPLSPLHLPTLPFSALFSVPKTPSPLELLVALGEELRCSEGGSEDWDREPSIQLPPLPSTTAQVSLSLASLSRLKLEASSR
jgi:hypothetical protein